MPEEAVINKNTGGSSIEITQNSKGDFQFAVKIYTGDLEVAAGQDILDLAQDRAINLAKKCITDIKGKLRPLV